MLAPGMRAAMTNHLAVCPACRQQVALARRLRTVFGPALKDAVGPAAADPHPGHGAARPHYLSGPAPRACRCANPWSAAALLLALLAATTSLVMAQFGLLRPPWQHDPTPLSVPTVFAATPTAAGAADPPRRARPPPAPRDHARRTAGIAAPVIPPALASPVVAGTREAPASCAASHAPGTAPVPGHIAGGGHGHPAAARRAPRTVLLPSPALTLAPTATPVPTPSARPTRRPAPGDGAPSDPHPAPAAHLPAAAPDANAPGPPPRRRRRFAATPTEPPPSPTWTPPATDRRSPPWPLEPTPPLGAAPGTGGHADRPDPRASRPAPPPPATPASTETPLPPPTPRPTHADPRRGGRPRPTPSTAHGPPLRRRRHSRARRAPASRRPHRTPTAGH